jgi:hypothetical protein
MNKKSCHIVGSAYVPHGFGTRLNTPLSDKTVCGINRDGLLCIRITNYRQGKYNKAYVMCSECERLQAKYVPKKEEE